MVRKCLIVFGIVAATVSATLAQDARPVVRAASKAMGVDGLDSITMSGAGSNSTLGQMPSPGGPFVRNNASDYVDNVQRLGLNPDQIVSVHAPNPDRQIPRQEVLASIGR